MKQLSLLPFYSPTSTNKLFFRDTKIADGAMQNCHDILGIHKLSMMPNWLQKLAVAIFKWKGKKQPTQWKNKWGYIALSSHEICHFIEKKKFVTGHNVGWLSDFLVRHQFFASGTDNFRLTIFFEECWNSKGRMPGSRKNMHGYILISCAIFWPPHGCILTTSWLDSDLL